ncbi:MAG TPA: TonB-dependent receptor [Bacteroidota bacterium]|nr:TonB-dependent receptor [Bacteroidota bacterium]
MKSRLLLLSILAFFCTHLATAGNTGKIAGEVKDSQTGEAIVGASVVIEGTSMGAATNIDGYYVILNIQPGKYTLVASGVGYNKKAVSNVQVSLDFTTTIDFKLTSTVVEVGEEVVTVAERPLVQKDLTASTATVNGEQISALPVTEVSQVLDLQAGVTTDPSGGLHLRGGRSGEVAYWIDGVPVTDAFNGTEVVEVNKSLVQELQLVSGAYNAEYGQALSGIVNISTKEGSQKVTGSVGSYIGNYVPNNDGASKALYTGLDRYRPFDIRDFEGNISGPVVGEDLTFFANGRYIYFGGDMYGIRRFTPQNIAYTDSLNQFHLYRDAQGHGDSSIVPMNSSERSYGQGKLTWHISPVMKLTGDFIYDRTKSQPYNREYYYDPDGQGNDYNTSETIITQFSHSLGSNTFYTFGGSIFYKRYQHYLYADPFDPRYVHPNVELPLDTWSFYTGGTDLNHQFRETRTLLGKLDLSSQIDEHHLIKAGAEFRQHRIFYDNYNLLPIPAETDLSLPYGNPFIQTYIPLDTTINHDTYLHHPREFSAYIQDKIEFKDLIINIGIRYDWFNPDGHVLADPTDPDIYAPIKPSNIFFDYNGNGVQDPGEPTKTIADRAAYWYVKSPAIGKLSPRIGFSFPITARGIVHFSYGQFFQSPRFEQMYTNPDFKIGSGTGNQGLVGNASLQPEETTKGELGVQQQLGEDISLDVTAFLQDIRNLTGTRVNDIVVFGGSASYTQYQNSDFGFVKGITVNLDKRFSAGLTASLHYTFSIANGSASNPDDARNALLGGALPEVQLNPLDWDQRHTLNAEVTYSASNWGASTIMQYGSGLPYTPRLTTDVTSLLTNSQTKPAFFDLDLRGYYEFHFDPMKLVAYIRVYNVFDIRNEINVYNDTGRAGVTIDESVAEQTNPAQRVNTLDQFFHTPTQYSEPRRFEFGMNLEF